MKLNEFSLEQYNLTEAEMHETMSSYRPMALNANDYFLKEGQVCTHIGFVTKGLLRAYFFDDQANEITTAFYPEGSLIISFDSFNNQVPARENIRAMEDSELMVVSYERQKELYTLVPIWNKVCKELADVASGEMLQRAKDFQILPAAERYQKFCDENPDLLQRVNLGHIASYIGVDNATLSRIRKKK